VHKGTGGGDPVGPDCVRRENGLLLSFQ